LDICGAGTVYAVLVPWLVDCESCPQGPKPCTALLWGDARARV
jgi:hypothetical protein